MAIQWITRIQLSLKNSVIMRIAEEGVGNFEGTAVQAAHARDHRA